MDNDPKVDSPEPTRKKLLKEAEEDSEDDGSGDDYMAERESGLREGKGKGKKKKVSHFISPALFLQQIRSHDW